MLDPQADYAMQVLSALLSWAMRPEQQLLKTNRVLGMERLYHNDRRQKVWSPDQIAAFLGKAPEPMRRAMVLAVETGQRQADLLRLSWGNVKADHIELRQLKTGTDVAVPISPALRDCFAGITRGDSTTVLTTGTGLPWNPKGNGFRSAWSDASRDAGISGLTFHDLRGAFATRKLAEGWSTEDVAFCTGHSLRDLASLERYVDRKSVAAARAKQLTQRMSANGE